MIQDQIENVSCDSNDPVESLAGNLFAFVLFASPM